MRAPVTARSLLAIGIIAVLAGCAAPAPPPATAALPAPGAYYAGTILAVRPVSTAEDSAGAVNQIMSTLGEPAAPQTSATELVIQLADGSVKCLVPPASANASQFTPGEHVTVSETPAMEVQAQ